MDYVKKLRSLHEAIINQKIKAVRKLLLENVNLNYKDKVGKTALHLAASVGNVQILRTLLTYASQKEEFLNIDARDDLDNTALHSASNFNNGESHIEVIKMLLVNEADVNAQNSDGETPLCLLAGSATVETIRLLLVFKASVAIKDKDGKTPLIKAVEAGNTAVMKLLLDSARKEKFNKGKSTSLHMVAMINEGESHFEVIDTLSKSGIDVNAKDKHGEAALHYLVNRGNVNVVKLLLDSCADVNIRNGVGNTPLHNAISAGNVKLVKSLLDRGADVNNLSKTGSTPLHESARLNHGGNQFKISEMLLKKGANVNAVDKTCKAPLHYLVEKSNVKTVKLFLNYKADVNIKNKVGEVPLFNAVRSKNSAEVVQLLLDHGSDVNSCNMSNMTPLHLAAINNAGDSHFDVAEVLLKNGANVDGKRIYERTPVQLLVHKANFRMIELFLDFNADFIKVIWNGETPLFKAIRIGKTEVVKLLLDRGSEVNFANTLNRLTPLHSACKSANYKIIKLIVKNGADFLAHDNCDWTPLANALIYFSRTPKTSSEKILNFLLKHADMNATDNYGKCLSSFLIEPNEWKIMLEHVALLQALDLPVRPNILHIIFQRDTYKKYFDMCTEELTLAKCTKLRDSWVTIFNLLVENRNKMKNYAGNNILINDFYTQMDCLQPSFDIYRDSIEENVKKGIIRRRFFDNSAVALSKWIPIFNSTHLIIWGVLDCLSTNDLKKLSK